jgi:hypothetical protein
MKVEVPPPVRREETRRWPDSGSTSTDVAKGPSGGLALEEMTQMVRDLEIAQARRDGGELVRDRKPLAGSRCLWCDAVGHARKDCRDFAETFHAETARSVGGNPGRR